MKNKNSGFTLLELMIALSIAVILTSVGIPSFTALISDSKMTANANDLLTIINYARSEAVTRNENVTLKSKNGNTWEDGWDVYIDADNDGVIDSGELLKSHKALATGYSLTANISGHSAGVANVAGVTVFVSDGLMSDITGGSFFLCLDNNVDTARAIILNKLGRARIDLEASQCS